jgi:predicted nucleic acid-binding protein
MTQPAPYTSTAEVLSERIRWAIACIARVVNEGRAAGWLEGAPIATAANEHDVHSAIDARIAVSPRDLRVAPMEWLAARLGLTALEVDLLWLFACVELDPGVARLAQVFGSAACPDLSVQIAQRLVALEGSQLDSLERFGLVEVVSDPRIPHHRRPIRINDRVIEVVRGELRLDPELTGVGVLHGRVDATRDPVAAIVRAIESRPAPLILAIGPDGAGRATSIAGAAGALGLGTLRVQTSALAREPVKLDRQLRAVIREACLFDVLPMFEELDGDRQHPARASVEHAMRSFTGPVLATAREPVAWRDRPVVIHSVEKPDRAAREAVWRECLDGAQPELITGVAETYQLRPGSIVAAARNALATAGNATALTAAAVHEGVRARMGDELGALATRIDWRQTWDDLVLPPDSFEQIIELVARVRHRSTVLESWGFAAKVGKGHGMAALFSGPPGTGKTMVAGLIASELGLDLYQVDLSKIVSKYIGETEKQLATLFEAAEAGHAILLFDEADSLFAKRSEVKSSNDRYANQEVNYLLQRMESFTGIALLTTNHETSIDEAFRRRLAVHVRFPMPEEEQREHLWATMIPSSAPIVANLEMARLAREFEMSGGYIKNAVLRAAYLAAEEGGAITMGHLWKSARAEYEAMGKVAYQSAA